MKGHFRKRGEKWYFWAELDAGPDGKRRQISRGGFTTRRAAEAAFADLRDTVRTGTFVQETKDTVAEFLLDEWLPAIQVSVRSTTIEQYRHYVNAYVVPSIGGIRLRTLKAAQLNAFYAAMLDHGRTQRKGGLSPKSVRNIHAMLHKAFADAVKWDRLRTNPTDRAQPPAAATPEMSVWSPEQLRTFLTSIESDRLYAAWHLLVTTGMRRGEILGLTWPMVDLDAGQLTIVRQLTVVNARPVVSAPKTAKGRRTIAIDKRTGEVLRRHRANQNRERLLVGDGWQDNELLFTQPDGSAINPVRMTKWFEQLVVRCGLPRIRLHDIRHSYATTALAAGIPAKIVSEHLGHANVSITLDRYTHVTAAMKQEIAAKVANLILD